MEILSSSVASLVRDTAERRLGNNDIYPGVFSGHEV
jgi:hypothetical protein